MSDLLPYYAPNPRTPAQVGELVGAFRAQGVPEADIQAALAADGLTLPPADERTKEQREFDDSFGGAAPSEYRNDYAGRLPPGTDIETHATFNAAASAWLSKVGFPPAIGRQVIEHAL